MHLSIEDQISLKFNLKDLTDLKVNVDLGDGLGPNKKHTITWTNDNHFVHWHIIINTQHQTFTQSNFYGTDKNNLVA